MIKRFLLHVEVKIGRTTFEDTEKFFFKFTAKKQQKSFTKFWEDQGCKVISYIIRLI